MSTRREDDSPPNGDNASQRTTVREAPIAKYEDVSAGTVPPRGLRGRSLLPGQGAPEHLVAEDVELAVLRDAETLDGPSVARAAARRPAEPSISPSPIPVSVEVPRARSLPPFDELPSTPTSPSGRSIQSGTLISVGSIDPRAPTERSLPSPRPLLVSERAAYFGPEAVVDRSPQRARLAPERHSQPPTDSARAPAAGVRSSSPSFEPGPNSSQRGVPASSARPALSHDSVAPPAQNFARAARSHSPVSFPAQGPMSARPAGGDASRLARAAGHSAREVPAPFQVHSELAALPQELLEDSFDLRSAYTQREPLASRKPQPSSDWVSVHAPTPESGRAPSSSAAASPRAVVPLSWLLAVLVGVLIALLAVWLLRPQAARDGARAPQAPARDRPTASLADSAPLLSPARPPGATSVVQPTPRASGAASPPVVPHSVAAKPAAPPSAARADAPFAAPSFAPSAAPDASSKVQQSIY